MAETPRLGQAEFRFYLTARIFDTIHRLAGVALYLGLAYIGFLTVKELAGKTTVANFLLAYITTGTESHGWVWLLAKILPWVLGLCFGGWAGIERYLRLRTVGTLQGRIKDLEVRLDPQRSTSMLTSRGETNPRDINL